jgi:hypothetical protein
MSGTTHPTRSSHREDPLIMTNTSTTFTNSLSPSDPHHLQHGRNARLLNKDAEKFAGFMIQNVPDHGRDPATKAAYVAGPMVPLLFSLAADMAGEKSKPFIECAYGFAMEQNEALTPVRAAADAVGHILEQPVHTQKSNDLPRGQLPKTLDGLESAATRAESHGDYTHRQKTDPGFFPWLLSGLLTGGEVSVYAMITNPSGINGLLLLLVVTGLLFMTNHAAAKWLGRSWREFRNRLSDKRQAETGAYAAAQNSGAAIAEGGDPYLDALIAAGKAPSEEVVREARTRVIVAAAVVLPLLAVLATAVGIRLGERAGGVGLGPVFPVLIGVLFGLAIVVIFLTIARLYSRGNELGDAIEEVSALIEETDELIATGSEEVLNSCDEARRIGDDALEQLALADDARAQVGAALGQGVNSALVTLGITAPVKVDPSRVQIPENHLRGRATAMLTESAAELTRIVQQIGGIQLDKAVTQGNPHETKYLDAPGGIDLEFVDPSLRETTTVDSPAMGSLDAGAARSRWSRGRVIGLVALVALLVAVGVAAWLLFGMNPASAAPAPVPGVPSAPSAPSEPSAAGLVEGVDYAFLDTDGPPVHWDCSEPVTVSVAADAPAGGAAAVEEAAQVIGDATGIQLQLVTGPADIEVAWAGHDTVAQIGSSGDAVGVAATSWSPLDGALTSVDITIDEDSPVNDPSTGTALQVLLHEFGHAVGLDHAEDGAAEVMAPAVDPAFTGLGAGDLLALAAVGCAV